MNQSKHSSMILGSVLLLAAAIIWGFAFVAQSVSMDYIKPYTFLCSRSFIGAAAVGVMLLIKQKVVLPKTMGKESVSPVNWSAAVKSGVICGLFLTVASAFQQFGMQYTEPGKAGFITSMYLLLVPIFGLFLGRKVGGRIWVCVAAAVVGLYLLCVNGISGIESGDLMVGVCAICFAGHILAVDHFGSEADSIALSMIQFLTVAVISGVLMLILEHPSWSSVMAAGLPILYAGLMSSGLGYTFQVIGQKSVPPTAASLLMSLESVFSVVGGFLILHQTMTAKELLGCVIMFIAVIAAQLPERKQAQVREKA